MRLALVHAERAGFEPGAPAVPDPEPAAAVERADCLFVLAGVEPEDSADGAGAEQVRQAAADLRCDAALFAFCPALVSVAADRERAARALAALAAALSELDTTVAPTDRHLALRVETAGHPSAVRTVRPDGARSSSAGFDPEPLETEGLADATEAGLRWTPAGVVARRALLAGVAERFAGAGADPVDPPLLPAREGVAEAVPDALRLADPPVLLRPRATFGVEPETGAVYATGPAVEGDVGVYRPEAFDADADSLDRWLSLTDATLRALGFDPTVRVAPGSDLAAPARGALGAAETHPGVAAGRVEFHTTGPTGVVERTGRGVRCVPVGSARRALAALADGGLSPALAPTQLRLVPIDGETERCRALAEGLAVRADVDDRHLPTGERLGDAADVPFVAVVGPADDSLPVAGPDGREAPVAPERVDGWVRERSGEWAWPPVPTRRPVRLSARRDERG